MKRSILITVLLLALAGLVLAALQCDGGVAPVSTKPPVTQPASTTAPGATQPPVQPTQPGTGPYPAATSEPPTPTATMAPGAYPPTTISADTLLNTRCKDVCHNLDRVTSAKKTRAEWQATVERMIGNGAKLTDEEKAVLITYLAATYK